MWKKHWKLISLMAVVCLGLCIGAIATKQVLDSEKALTIDQVPAAVKATILAQANGATIQEIEMETKDGKTVYEAEVIINGQEVDIVVAPDGTLIGKETEDNDDGDDDEGEIEEIVTLDDVPTAAKETILKESVGAKIVEVVKEIEDGRTVYEAEVIIDGQEVDIVVAPDGTSLGKEVEDEDEND